ncbi:histidinol dehydrogenase [Helicobacter canis]|uniref:histidinol dehydrogenase n=1 Tax=Helicobacter canis TaxID=29419 RepID=UPI0026F07B54|nr:histidinol dehydrogenase [Helicobacter canis]
MRYFFRGLVMVTILHTSQNGFAQEFGAIVQRGQDDLHSAEQIVLPLLEEIRTQGLGALLSQVARFDGFAPKDLADLVITQEECAKAYQNLDSTTKDALHIAYDRITAFHTKQKQKSWFDSDEHGSILGQIYTPIQRAGLYIPGGKAAYPSSVLMNAIPALVAGVREIIVCTPTPQGQANPLLLAALHICGIKEMYRVGGASAIGVFAYGLESSGKTLIPKVDVISGPGNVFVATAKKLVFGKVGIDMIAGPSEIAIIADSSANPAYIARDLLSQAEHDEMASSLLFTTSQKLAEEVASRIEELLPSLPKSAIANASIQNRGGIVVCKDIDEAITLCNELAPEHLELMFDDAFAHLPAIKNAGAIFVGENTPEAIGDYLAGPNHTLPTGGSAKFFSPLSVDTFMKKSSLIAFSQQGIDKLAEPCAHLAELEGLYAHKLSALVRKS